MNDSNDSDEASYRPSFETFRADPNKLVMPKTNNTQTLQLSLCNKLLLLLKFFRKQRIKQWKCEHKLVKRDCQHE